MALSRKITPQSNRFTGNLGKWIFIFRWLRSQSIFLISMHFVQTLALQIWRTISSATSQYVFLFGRTSGFCFGKESSQGAQTQANNESDLIYSPQTINESLSNSPTSIIGWILNTRTFSESSIKTDEIYRGVDLSNWKL